MQASIKKADANLEFETGERCFILEVANDDDDDILSISRARVLPGVTTQWHQLKGIDERYLIVRGHGRVEVQGIEPTEVHEGDVVRIPAGTPQRITNTGAIDLLFYCICSPRFHVNSYNSLEENDDKETDHLPRG